MEPRVLLINPPICISNRIRQQIMKFSINIEGQDIEIQIDETMHFRTPPLGLAYIAAFIEPEYDVQILDMNALNMLPEDVLSALKRYNPDIVGVSLNMACTYSTVLRILRLIKQYDREIITIVGGNFATFSYERIFKELGDVDIIVRYEGEKTFYELVKAFSKGVIKDRLKDIRGIAYKSNQGNIVVTPPREVVMNLDELPMPARHLLPMEYYDESYKGALISSRGCPFKCVFCSTSRFFGFKVRTRSIDKVIEEIREIVDKYKARLLVFYDDLFVPERKRLEALLKFIREEKLDISWLCNTNSNLLDDTTLKLMSMAGCKGMFVGIESSDPKVQMIIGKRLDIERARKCLIKAKEYGMLIDASFILGLPYQTWDSIYEDIKFIRDTKPDILVVNFLVPYPGTDIYENPQKYRIRIISYDYDLYTHTVPVIETDFLTVKDMIEAKKLILSNYFSIRLRDVEEELGINITNFIKYKTLLFRLLLQT